MTADNIRFVGNSVTVFVATTSVKENYLNAIKPLNIPTTETTPVTTNLINLNKIEDRFTITGSLNNGKLDSSETHTNAIDKKNALKAMFSRGETVTMTWEGEDFEVGVDKYEIGYNAQDDKVNIQDGIAVYDVIISCVVGIDLV